MKQFLLIGTAVTALGCALLAFGGIASAGEGDNDATATAAASSTVTGDDDGMGTPMTGDVTPSAGGAEGAVSTPATSTTPLAGGGELPDTGTGPGGNGQTMLAWMLMVSGAFGLMGAVMLGYANRSRAQ
jgi:hypothetical protein